MLLHRSITVIKVLVFWDFNFPSSDDHMIGYATIGHAKIIDWGDGKSRVQYWYIFTIFAKWLR